MFARLGLLLIFFLNLNGFASETSSTVNHMREKIENLSEGSNFVFVDLGISSGDLELFQQFSIKQNGQYNRFGNLDLLRDELPTFLREIGTNSEPLIQRITETLFQIASNVKEASNKETAWVCVRTSTPDQAFDMPRWHMDGYYYSPYTGFSFKFAAALKGNSTLFYQLSKETREVFNSHFGDREFLSRLLSTDGIESPNPGQGAFFLVGDKDYGAAHSEPKIDGERLFISILPGNENEIMELKARWQ